MLAISNTTIVSNTSTDVAGGVSILGGTALIHGSLIAGNSAVSATSACYGGGIRYYNSTLVIRDSVLRDNWVSGPFSLGGAIAVGGGGSTTLDRVTVSGNSSSYRAGGIRSADPLTMTNVTVSGNSAADVGGGLMQVDGGTATLVNCTIASNTLSSGSPLGAGGIQANRPVTVTYTLLAGNDNCGISGGSLNSGGTNLEDGDSCALSAMGDITSTNPFLGPLAYYGGPMVGAPGTQEPMHLHSLLRGQPGHRPGEQRALPGRRSARRGPPGRWR
jgi:hypothetical protein